MTSSDHDRGGLRRLIYASRFTGLARDLDEALRSIIAQSIQNNRLEDVTGFLMAGEGRFLQLLEGPANSVEAIYQRITADPRHTDLARIYSGPAERRLFRDWNMGQYRLSARDGALLAESGLGGFAPAALDSLAAETLLLAAGRRHSR